MTDVSDIENLPPLREVIRLHGLRAEKSLGQNFLLDLNLTGKIARASKSIAQSTVFEIGPGPGGLTRALLTAGAKNVIAIEYDARAVEALQSLVQAAHGSLHIVQGDALKTGLMDISRDYNAPPPYVIVANLPYNIATPLLVGWLENISRDIRFCDEMVLMFQKEVAQRIVARPSTKAYGRLSILCQWLCDCKLVFDVPASAFTPPPKVTSSIVRLVPKKERIFKGNFDVMEKLTMAAFGQRRKMIRGSLKEYLSYVEEAGLNPQARAEELDVAAFESLANLISKAPL